MQFGFLALIIALAADFKFKQIRSKNLTIDEYERLSYRTSGKEVYLFLGIVAALVIADQNLPEREQEIGIAGYSLIASWLLYTRLRVYIEAKINKINPEYTRYALFSVIVVGIASAIMISEQATQM